MNDRMTEVNLCFLQLFNTKLHAQLLMFHHHLLNIEHHPAHTPHKQRLLKEEVVDPKKGQLC